MGKKTQCKNSEKHRNAGVAANTIHIIGGSANTGTEIQQAHSRNTLVVTEIVTSLYSHVKTAVLVTREMSEDDATKLLNKWWVETSGRKFAAWIALNEFEESIFSNNFNLTEAEQTQFFEQLLKNMGLNAILLDAHFTSMGVR